MIILIPITIKHFCRPLHAQNSDKAESTQVTRMTNKIINFSSKTFFHCRKQLPMLLEISTKTSSLSTSNKFLKSLLFFCDLFIFALIHPLSQAPVLIAVEKFSIDTGKERCPLCYVHFGNSGSFLGRTECGAVQGRAGWL